MQPIKKGKNSIKYDPKTGFFDLWIKNKGNEIMIFKSHEFYFDGCFWYIYFILSTRLSNKLNEMIYNQLKLFLIFNFKKNEFIKKCF